MKALWIGLIVVALIAIGGYIYPKAGAALFGTANCQGGVTCYTDLAALTSFESDGTTLTSTFTQGGGVTATSSAANATILASDFDVENGIEVSLPVGAVTLTLPASTTFPLGTTPGSYREFTMFNASTTAGATVTIAGGTGTLLEVASSTVTTALKVIQPSGVAIFTAFRKADSDIEVFMNPGQ